MAETMVKSEVVRPVSTPEAVEHARPVVEWTANVTEKVLAIPLGMARVARAEAFRAAYSGVDWLESLNQAQFKVARELVHRIELVTLDVMQGAESLASATTGRIRGAGEAAGAVVARTATALRRKEPASAPA